VVEISSKRDYCFDLGRVQSKTLSKRISLSLSLSLSYKPRGIEDEHVVKHFEGLPVVLLITFVSNSSSNADQSPPTYDPLPHVANKEWSSLKFTKSAIHIIPLVLYAIILWFFSI
jgi:hypothetical protein